MEEPVYYWDPVIAPSGLAFYSGNLFPQWKDSVFVGGLRGPSRRVPRPGELLFEFARESDRAQFRCELRYHGDYWGVEAQFLMNGE